MKRNRLLVAGLSALMLFGCSNNAKETNDASAENGMTQTTEETSSGKSYGINESADLDGIVVTVKNAETTDSVDDFYNNGEDLENGQKYEVIDLSIENNTDSEVTISSMLSFTLVDKNGNEAENKLATGDKDTLDGTIEPGETLSGSLVFVVDDGENLTLTYEDLIAKKSVSFKI